MFQRTCSFIQKFPKSCLTLSLLLLFVSAPGLMFFQSQNDVRIWFNKKDDKIKILNSFERRFGNDESLVIAVHHPEGLFTPARMQAVTQLGQGAWRLPQVIRVDSLVNFSLIQSLEDEISIEPFLENKTQWTQKELNAKKQTALNHKTLPGYLISKDGKTSLIFARLAPTLKGSPNYELIINKARELIQKYQGENGLQVFLSGEAAMNNTFREVSNQDMKKILPILLVFLILSLLFIFRSPTAMLLPLFITAATLLTTLGSAFYFGLKFNSILGILPAIIIAVSVADSVHIMVSYFQFKAKGSGFKEAAALSLKKNIIPVFLTSISTMMGFMSLTLTELIPIQRLGFLAGLGCLMALFYSLFFLGSFLFLVDLKTPAIFQKLFGQENTHNSYSEKLTLFVVQKKTTILVFFGLLSVVAIGLSSTNTINSNPLSYFSKGVPLKKANDFILNNFGGNAGPEFMIRSGKVDGIKDPEFLRKVENFKSWLSSFDFVDKTVDIVDIVKDMNQSLHAGDPSFYRIPDTQNKVAELLFLYTLSLPQGMDLNNRMSLDYRDMRMSVLWQVKTSALWGEMVQKIETKAQDLGLDLVVTGKTNLFQSMMGYVVTTFFKSILTASFLVCLLMIILFKSIKIGLISLIPNFIPLFLGGAYMKLLGLNLNIGTTLVASVCLGIAVDDTIHFLSNYYRLTREEGKTREQAIEIIFAYTGNALMITTIILVSCFGLFMLGDFTPNVNFGLLSALVLISALIVDFIFLPALLLTGKNRNS